MNRGRTKVMVFGVFDGLHDGHRFFLNEAQNYGDELIIVVTLDDTVKWMKDESPIYSLPIRIQNLEKEYPKAIVIPGDNKSNTWNVIKTHDPDIIVLGYDQGKIEKSLFDLQLKFGFEIRVIEKNYKGNKLHSSLLRKK
jgi:FAD synthetase